MISDDFRLLNTFTPIVNMTLSETTSFNDQEHALEHLIKELIEDGQDQRRNARVY